MTDPVPSDEQIHTPADGDADQAAEALMTDAGHADDLRDPDIDTAEAPDGVQE